MRGHDEVKDTVDNSQRTVGKSVKSDSHHSYVTHQNGKRSLCEESAGFLTQPQHQSTVGSSDIIIDRRYTYIVKNIVCIYKVWKAVKITEDL